MPPSQGTRGHLSGAVLREDDGFGGRFAPPETAGAEGRHLRARGKTDGG